MREWGGVTSGQIGVIRGTLWGGTESDFGCLLAMSGWSFLCYIPYDIF